MLNVSHQTTKLNYKIKYKIELEICLVERGICPIATLYSLAAAFQRLTLVSLQPILSLNKNGWLP